MDNQLASLANIVSSVAVGLAAIITAFFAARATSQWRSQKKIQIEHDLAIQMLTLLYRFEDAIKEFRNGFAHLEIKEDEDRAKEHHEFVAWRDLYTKRGSLVTEASGSIKALSHHAKAIWGDLLSPELTKLFNSQSELFWAAGDFLRSKNPSIPAYERQSAQLDSDQRKILYRMGSEDIFEQTINDAIEKMASKLRPKMIR